MYVVPDTPEKQAELAAQRDWAPAYEDSLQDVARVLARLILKGEASPEEIEEFNALPPELIDNLPPFDEMVR